MADSFAERTHRMLSFGYAQNRDVESLQNWVNGTGCLARQETAYLAHGRDLVSLAPAGDNAMVRFEIWVEDKLIRFYRGFREVIRITSRRFSQLMLEIEPLP